MEEQEVPLDKCEGGGEGDKESKSQSSALKKNFVLGVVNAAEIKCTVARKRRWDQPPEDSSPEKRLCVNPSPPPSTSGSLDPPHPQQNNIQHDPTPDSPYVNTFSCKNSQVLCDSGSKTMSDIDGNLQTEDAEDEIIVKEQIIVQTPSEILNQLEINPSFPITSGINELKYIDGNRQVTIEIETVEVTPREDDICDDVPKNSLESSDLNSESREEILRKRDQCSMEIDDTVVSLINNTSGVNKDVSEQSKLEVKCSVVDVPLDQEDLEDELDRDSGGNIERDSIDIKSAGSVDPAVMEVILGIKSNPSKENPSSQTSDVNNLNEDTGESVDSNLNITREIMESDSKSNDNKLNENTDSEVQSFSSVHNNLHPNEMNTLINKENSDSGDNFADNTVKLVDYESSNDKNDLIEDTNEVLISHEEKSDSKEVQSDAVSAENHEEKDDDDEFHDCIEAPNIDESTTKDTLIETKCHISENLGILTEQPVSIMDSLTSVPESTTDTCVEEDEKDNFETISDNKNAPDDSKDVKDFDKVDDSKEKNEYVENTCVEDVNIKEPDVFTDKCDVLENEDNQDKNDISEVKLEEVTESGGQVNNVISGEEETKPNSELSHEQKINSSCDKPEELVENCEIADIPNKTEELVENSEITDILNKTEELIENSEISCILDKTEKLVENSEVPDNPQSVTEQNILKPLESPKNFIESTNQEGIQTAGPHLEKENEPCASESNEVIGKIITDSSNETPLAVNENVPEADKGNKVTLENQYEDDKISKPETVNKSVKEDTNNPVVQIPSPQSACSDNAVAAKSETADSSPEILSVPESSAVTENTIINEGVDLLMECDSEENSYQGLSEAQSSSQKDAGKSEMLKEIEENTNILDLKEDKSIEEIEIKDSSIQEDERSTVEIEDSPPQSMEISVLNKSESLQGSISVPPSPICLSSDQQDSKPDSDSNSLLLSYMDVESEVVIVPDTDSQSINCLDQSSTPEVISINSSNCDSNMPPASDKLNSELKSICEIEIPASDNENRHTESSSPCGKDKSKSVSPIKLKLSPTLHDKNNLTKDVTEYTVQNSNTSSKQQNKSHNSSGKIVPGANIPLLATVASSRILEKKLTETKEVIATDSSLLKKGSIAVPPKMEPITLRIFKDSHSLQTESMDSPKKSKSPKSGGDEKGSACPVMNVSPKGSSTQSKQLGFTLKISKDANTNIPKATVSPKGSSSVSVWKTTDSKKSDHLPEIVSSTAVLSEKIVKVSPKRPKQLNKWSSNLNDLSISVVKKDNLIKSDEDSISGDIVNSDNRVSSVSSSLIDIPESKIDIKNCLNDTSSDLDESLVEVDDQSEDSVNILSVSSLGSRKPTPSPLLKRRGRPRKTLLARALEAASPGNTSLFGSSSLDSTPSSEANTPSSSRPMRECRDRTKPIVVKTRRPRGSFTPRGSGRGRGGLRTPLIPGRESLSAKEREELAKIDARKEQMRIEKQAKRDAKLAKKAMKMAAAMEGLTDEQREELARRRQQETEEAAKEREKVEAELAVKREQERIAEEARLEAARIAKEEEKAAKIAARRAKLMSDYKAKRDAKLAKKALKKLKDEERRKRKAAEKAAEQAALQNMYEDETRMSAPDSAFRHGQFGDDSLGGYQLSAHNKRGRMEISMDLDGKDVGVEQLAEYQWEGSELYMIQEQVAEYLGVKSFKRKYPELKRRDVGAEERKFLEDSGLVPKSLCELGVTAVPSAEVLDIMFQDFPEKYEEVRKFLREKQMREISSRQKAMSLLSKQNEKAKADLREQALENAAVWNAQLNKERKEERLCSMDLQSFIVHYPASKREAMSVKVDPPGAYPVPVLPGQYCDYYKTYTSAELMYYPVNTVLYGPMRPNERDELQSEGSQSESDDSSSSDDSTGSSSDESDSEAEEESAATAKCKVCVGNKKIDSNGQQEIFLQCSKCKLLSHLSCCSLSNYMVPHVRKYNWQCAACKVCVKCNNANVPDKIILCDLCDRGFHSLCAGVRKLSDRRWHCHFCSYCWVCGSKEPGLSDWIHEFTKDEKGGKNYKRTLCSSCHVGPGVSQSPVVTPKGSHVFIRDGKQIILREEGSSRMTLGTPPGTPARQVVVTPNKRIEVVSHVASVVNGAMKNIIIRK